MSGLKTVYAHVLLISFSLIVLGPDPVQGQTTEYEYPELLVTPSASKRLESEAAEENSSRYLTHLPIQAASLLVFSAGLMALDDGPLESQEAGEKPMARWAGIGAMSSGLGWLAITGALSAVHKPYTKGRDAVAQMPAGTKRQLLEKERAAERFLAAPASLGTRVQWLSIFFNFSMSAFVVSATEDKMTKVVGAAAALGSFTPLLFSSRWIETYDSHQDYRKRIYGPVGEAKLLHNPWAKQMVPGYSLTWNL